MTQKSYKGAAVTARLTGSLSSGATTFTVDTATGFPDGITPAHPFVVTFDRGSAGEEKVLCDSRSGTTFTVNISGRGYDGTSASAHTAGVTVEHTLDAATLTDVTNHAFGTGTDHSGLALLGHTHTLTYGTPVAVGAANAAGSDTALVRRDHVHQSNRYICTSGTRPGAPFEGLEIYETDTDRTYVYSGSAWVFDRRQGASTGFECDLASASIPTGSFTILQWNVELFDSDNYFSSPQGTIAIPAGLDGVYVISARGSWASSLSGAVGAMFLSAKYGWTGLSTGGNGLSVSAAGVYLTAGDQITVYAYQASGASVNLIDAHMSVYRIGP